MALATVSDLVAQARVLLQDQVEDYRYGDDELIASLNMGLLEARRLRPDLFLSTPTVTPSYSAVDSTVIAINEQYRMALLYFVVGHTNLQDEESVQDSRASAFLQKFTSIMVAAV